MSLNSVDPFGDGSGIALYPFNGNANDLSGNHNGTWDGTEDYSTGKFGQAAKFSGNKITFSTIHLDDFTISLWVQFSSTDDGAVYITANNAGGTNLITTEFNESGTLTIDITGEKYEWDVGHHFGIDDIWHIAYIREGDKGSVFVNGEQIGDTATIKTDSYPLDRFCRGDFTGILDQVRIFNRALTSSEVTTLYNESAPINITIPLSSIDLTSIINDVVVIKNVTDITIPLSSINLTLSANIIDVYSNVARIPITSIDLTIIVNSVVVNSNSTISSPTTNLTLSVNDVVVIKNVTHITIPISSTNLTSEVNIPIYIGLLQGVTVNAVTIPIYIHTNYLPRPINITFVQNIPIQIKFKLDEFLNTNTRVIPSVTNLTITCNYFASLFSDKKPRVIRIDTLDVVPSMYFSENNKDYLSSTRTTIDGKDILFSERVGKFLKKETIESDSDFWYSQDFLRRLGLLIAQNKEITLYFNNGYRVQARFDILNNPLTATPIHLGSCNYYVAIEVLI